MTQAPSKPIQCELSVPVSIHGPMVDVGGARGILRDVDEDGILELISDKVLPWAFDIRKAQAKRSEVRIFTHCVWLYKLAREGQPVTPQVETLEGVVDWLFPHKRPTLWATDLKRQWNTSSTHIHNLIKDGLLQAVPGTGDKINKTPTVLRASAAAFMKERQM